MSYEVSRAWPLLLVAPLLASGCDDVGERGDASRDGAAMADAEAQRDAAVDGTADAAHLPHLDAAPDANSVDAAVDDSALADAGADATAAADAAPSVCNVSAPTACPTPAPTYTANVAAILSARCTGCHGKTWMGPWPLDTYSHVADWKEEIRAAMLDCSMPPADAGAAMTDAERGTILDWLRCDLPR